MPPPLEIPTAWIPELAFEETRRTLADLEPALARGGCIGQVETRAHWYESFWQNVWNGLRTIAIGQGIDRSQSRGTAIVFHLYCHSDTRLTETREILVSATLRLDAECQLLVTEVRQRQVEGRRDWVRWTVTHLVRDDLQSAAVDTTVGGLLAYFGIAATGATAVLASIAGAASAIGDFFLGLNRIATYVARNTAPPQRIWLDDGPPSSRLVLRRLLPPDECAGLRAALGPAVAEGLTFGAPPPG